MSTNPPFLVLPGENLKISGDIDNLQASGTEIYDKISEVTELKNKENEIKNIREEITEAYKIQDKKNNRLIKHYI